MNTTQSAPSDTLLSIVIPAFNEESGIGTTLVNIRNAFPNAEIIVVDDGSTDQTRAIANSIPGVHVVAHPMNRGYGAAIRTGARLSTRQAICWYDADGQHTPDNLRALFQTFLEGEWDAVLGERDQASHQVRQRKMGKRFLAFLVSMTAGQHVPDMNCGLRIFSRNVLMRYLHLIPDGFSASITTTLLMYKRCLRFTFVKITTSSRQGKSTVSQVRDGLRSIQVILRILILFHAMPTFSWSAFVLILFSTIYSIWIMIQQKLGLPVAGAVGMLTGVLLFFMGLLCDQIVAMRMERLEQASMIQSSIPSLTE